MLSSDCGAEIIPEDYDIEGMGRFWESEQGAAQTMDVQGRLRDRLNYWENVLKLQAQ